MNTKLIINLSDGTVHAEGNEDFVRFIYQDFKDSLSKHPLVNAPAPVLPSAHDSDRNLLTNDSAQSIATPSNRKKTISGEGEKTRTTQAKPKYNKNLDLTGLAEFYDELKPEKYSEKILVFAVFLRDRLGTSPCTSDDVYTCFFELRAKTKIPTAFQQAFIDTRNRTHFIDFRALDAIEINIAGENWVTEQAKRIREQAK